MAGRSLLPSCPRSWPSALGHSWRELHQKHGLAVLVSIRSARIVTNALALRLVEGLYEMFHVPRIARRDCTRSINGRIPSSVVMAKDSSPRDSAMRLASIMLRALGDTRSLVRWLAEQEGTDS